MSHKPNKMDHVVHFKAYLLNAIFAVEFWKQVVNIHGRILVITSRKLSSTFS